MYYFKFRPNSKFQNSSNLTNWWVQLLKSTLVILFTFVCLHSLLVLQPLHSITLYSNLLLAKFLAAFICNFFCGKLIKRCVLFLRIKHPRYIIVLSSTTEEEALKVPRMFLLRQLHLVCKARFDSVSVHPPDAVVFQQDITLSHVTNQENVSNTMLKHFLISTSQGFLYILNLYLLLVEIEEVTILATVFSKYFQKTTNIILNLRKVEISIAYGLTSISNKFFYHVFLVYVDIPIK